MFRPAVPSMLLALWGVGPCSRPPDDTAALTLALRHGIQLAQSGEAGHVDAFCLASADSPDSLVNALIFAALSDHLPPVYPASDCHRDPSFGGYRIVGTPLRAALVWARLIDHESGGRAVELGFNAGPLAAAAYTCRFRRTRSGWEIDPCTLYSIEKSQ